jgi:hypothetical protein
VARVPDEQPNDDALLRSGELATLLGVSRRSVARWDLPCLRTLGGHRRFGGATCAPASIGTDRTHF